MATALDELADAGLIHIGARKGEEAVDAHNRSVERCDLTEKGTAVLKALQPQIPPATRRFLTQYLEERGLQRKIADAVTAKIDVTPDGQYEVTCRQKEGGDTSFLLTLRFPTETMARKAAEMWREHADYVVQTLVRVMLEQPPRER